jgi:hypothetical protein
MVPVAVRMPEPLVAQLRDVAQGSDRSFSAELRVAVREHVAKVAQEASAAA